MPRRKKFLNTFLELNICQTVSLESINILGWDESLKTCFLLLVEFRENVHMFHFVYISQRHSSFIVMRLHKKTLKRPKKKLIDNSYKNKENNNSLGYFRAHKNAFSTLVTLSHIVHQLTKWPSHRFSSYNWVNFQSNVAKHAIPKMY